MSDGLLDMLREKTGEGDLNSILKPSMGGYTKRSVMEYLAFVKKQQQSMKDSYAGELQRLQSEAVTLQSEADAMRHALETAESDCQAKIEAALDQQAQRMQSDYDALEKDMDEAVTRIKEDEAQILEYRKRLAEQIQKSEQSKQNTSTARIMLDTANAKIDELTRLLTRQASDMERMQEVEKNLREKLAEDKVSDLNLQIQELIQDVELLKNEISIRDQELSNREKRLETLTRQEQTNHHTLEQLQIDLQNAREQNEWLETENGELGQRLQAQTQQIIALSREVAHQKAANAILQRKLEAEQTRRQLTALSAE